MVKKALLDCSSGKGIVLSLDGVPLKGVISIGNITNVRDKDTVKEIK